MRSINALCLLGSLLTACASEQQQSSPAELVVAEVGSKKITTSDLADFVSRIPEGMREGATPLAANKKLLESLIDKELLLQEAKASNLENTTWFIDELTNYERSQILRLYERREIISKLNITAEMVEAYYHKTRRDRSIRLGGIMVDTQEEADQIRTLRKRWGIWGEPEKPPPGRPSLKKTWESGLGWPGLIWTGLGRDGLD